jgi:hypothetical protein
MLKVGDRVRVGLVDGRRNRLFGREGTIERVFEQEPYAMLNVIMGKEAFTLFENEVERIKNG